MSKGVYNQTYFNNRPEEQLREGVLYGVILVNTQTFERECIKVGCVFNEPTTTPSTTVGNTNSSYTRSLNTIVINPNKSLVGIRSASKFHPLFYQTFQKITLDKWSLV